MPKEFVWQNSNLNNTQSQCVNKSIQLGDQDTQESNKKSISENIRNESVSNPSLIKSSRAATREYVPQKDVELTSQDEFNNEETSTSSEETLNVKKNSSSMENPDVNAHKKYREDEDIEEYNYSKSPKRKSVYNDILLKKIFILISITLILGVVIGIGISNKISSSKIEKLTETISQYKKELEERELENQLLQPDDFLILENGDYFWGNIDNLGHPNGFGILLHEDTYYIGNYVHGKKNGKITAINEDGEQKIENYKNGNLIIDGHETNSERNDNSEDFDDIIIF